MRIHKQQQHNREKKMRKAKEEKKNDIQTNPVIHQLRSAYDPVKVKQWK